MKIVTRIIPLLLIGVAFAATPAQAHISYDMTETITGTVRDLHYLNGVPILPAEVVSFTWKETQTYDCETGRPVGQPVETIEYAGSQIEGEGGIYAFLGFAFFGQAGAGASGWGSGVPVSFAVGGEGVLGQHGFAGSGVGHHSITDPDPLCAPPVEIPGLDCPGIGEPQARFGCDLLGVSLRKDLL